MQEKTELRYWVKMKVYGGTTTWVSKCKHMGQTHLYSYIIATFNRATGEWSNTGPARTALKQLYDLEESTIYRYLGMLKREGLLNKGQKGTYLVNPEWISYGEDTGGRRRKKSDPE
ncbi:hypothetical protein FAES_3261 [Fibrella aestuarina BUZ 2]|uniref:Plasmid replication protein RepL domain-containing protein n=1 Tax=Fibrella aestuarina BUZ 2 TaxID=1166018 RepID=I0KAW7_9BACT|nr:hypothetical protein [Fibrella aestuarina]CCH01270.1 hypothetical protein FAES_3261 [Fibrella aestuarina BUZ 2]